MAMDGEHLMFWLHCLALYLLLYLLPLSKYDHDHDDDDGDEGDDDDCKGCDDHLLLPIGPSTNS